MTSIDRAMIVVSGIRVVADLAVATVTPDWSWLVALLAPGVSAAQMLWVVGALRRFDQQGPYTVRNPDS